MASLSLPTSFSLWSLNGSGEAGYYYYFIFFNLFLSEKFIYLLYFFTVDGCCSMLAFMSDDVSLGLFIGLLLRLLSSFQTPGSSPSLTPCMFRASISYSFSSFLFVLGPSVIFSLIYSFNFWLYYSSVNLSSYHWAWSWLKSTNLGINNNFPDGKVSAE